MTTHMLFDAPFSPDVVRSPVLEPSIGVSQQIAALVADYAREHVTPLFFAELAEIDAFGARLISINRTRGGTFSYTLNDSSPGDTYAHVRIAETSQRQAVTFGTDVETARHLCAVDFHLRQLEETGFRRVSFGPDRDPAYSAVASHVRDCVASDMRNGFRAIFTKGQKMRLLDPAHEELGSFHCTRTAEDYASLLTAALRQIQDQEMEVRLFA